MPEERTTQKLGDEGARLRARLRAEQRKLARLLTERLSPPPEIAVVASWLEEPLCLAATLIGSGTEMYKVAEGVCQKKDALYPYQREDLRRECANLAESGAAWGKLAAMLAPTAPDVVEKDVTPSRRGTRTVAVTQWRGGAR